MASRGFAPLSSRQENIMGLGRADGLRALKPGQRAVLGVLTENDQHNRVFGQVSSKYVPAFCDASSRDVSTSSATLGDHVVEPVIAQSTKQSPSFLLPSELLLVDDAVQDLGSGMLADQVYKRGSCMDSSMQSLPEEEAAASEDVLCVPEYAEDIHRYLRECEVKYRPKPGYMRKQPDITNCMRIILVDWLVEVGEEYKLCCETLYLAVNYLDRFLSCMSVLRGKLQLVGTAAILLAAKYEEVYPPEVDEFVYITDDTYTKKQLLQMEQHLLRVLAFDMTAPTVHQFLMQYTLEEHICASTVNLALYLSELSLLEVDPFVQYLPSKTAAAAYCLANYTLNGVLWPENLYAFTGYSLAVIIPCLKELHKLHLGAAGRPQQAIQEKYKSSKYCGVSLLEPVESLPLP
ncbi:cyclin-A1 isoform X1 [Sinocyclocheilus anshuiensis]|uniref:cyclin-A1 isoform X1 n=1 Tax=Sinocyclocheilus anshuiensis TaxID=1608454 RepID=UPI0007BA3663|nr:PREDICTED: cyclin-A1 isoform X1 [Sinocyclocheilus anshuiensis]XP_016338535.1 PREDICTED: cyclin-A1 isoform X1 [Sinocyclocheilus anshuiensis]XP_016338536.1 PREDICTED: cyclin-A1 isoform X1 [Sinocyclocheilus anshuiensis]XP_016338537.1 PREDICTED: cyclin-A1 isoform X1 [Sinocyclocheilus anshuiensis]